MADNTAIDSLYLLGNKHLYFLSIYPLYLRLKMLVIYLIILSGF